jgi:hypothetical protein
VLALGVTVICAPVSPVLHTIVPAQFEAVNVTEFPAQMFVDGLAEIIGTVGEFT